MDYLKNYDETSPTSIEQYAQQLIGLSFEDVIALDTENSIIKEDSAVYGAAHENKKRKNAFFTMLAIVIHNQILTKQAVN